MKKSFVLMMCIIFAAGARLSAQITITAGDVQAYVSIGNSIDFTTDTSTTAVDIGSTGSTAWDFSGLSADIPTSFTCINPAGTPFAGDFPSATSCFYGIADIQGYELESWQYLSVNNALLLHGLGAQGTVSGFTINYVSSNNPALKIVEVPLTYGTSWTQDYVATDTTHILPLPPSVTVTNYHTVNTVDAYGTMTLPGGGTTQALRVRTDETSNGAAGYSRSITYLFLAKTGTQISITAADTNSANTGVIPVSDVTFIFSSVTGVSQTNNNNPENFSLEQNYPNPFNPTTQINYSIPSSQRVMLKVYDELGREVATLVNKDQPAGNYTVDFNAAGLASGVYIYRLQAGDYGQMKKMILMK